MDCMVGGRFELLHHDILTRDMDMKASKKERGFSWGMTMTSDAQQACITGLMDEYLALPPFDFCKVIKSVFGVCILLDGISRARSAPFGVFEDTWVWVWIWYAPGGSVTTFN